MARHLFYIIIIGCLLNSCTKNNDKKAEGYIRKWIKSNLKNYDIDSIKFSDIDSVFFSIYQQSRLLQLEKDISRFSKIVERNNISSELNERYYKIHLKNHNVELALLNRLGKMTRNKNMITFKRELEAKRSAYDYIKNNPKFKGFSKHAYIHYPGNYIIDTIIFQFDRDIERIIALKQ